MTRAEAFSWSEGADVFDNDPSSPVARLARGHPICDLFHHIRANRAFQVGPNGIVSANREDGAFGTQTAGTSGTPKPVWRSAASWIASFRVNAGLFSLSSRDRYAVLGGMEHSLALYASLEALWIGAQLHRLQAMRADRWADAFVARGVSVVYATPAQLRLVLTGGTKSRAMRLILSGGAKLDEATKSQLAVQFPNTEIREFYGTSETSFVAMADHACPSDAVGQLYPGVTLAPGADIRVQSPYLALSAVKDAEGFVATGEVGWLDVEGHLHLSGRRDRMVTIADSNVFPEEVEATLMSLDGVRVACVVPVPDPARGTVFLAYLAGSGEVATDRILRSCRTDLGPMKTPKKVIWLQDWPILASGKTDIRALTDMARQVPA